MKLDLINTVSWIWTNTDSITKWIQVVALVVAGYWAYTRFIRVDAPSLEPVAHLELVGSVLSQHDDLCRINVKLVVHNDGHTSFDVGRVQVQGWQSTAPLPTDGSPAYFNVNKMREGTVILNVSSLPDLSCPLRLVRVSESTRV
jgi:hypothetical protein